MLSVEGWIRKISSSQFNQWSFLYRAKPVTPPPHPTQAQTCLVPQALRAHFVFFYHLLLIKHNSAIHIITLDMISSRVKQWNLYQDSFLKKRNSRKRHVQSYNKTLFFIELIHTLTPVPFSWNCLPYRHDDGLSSTVSRIICQRIYDRRQPSTINNYLSLTCYRLIFSI